VAALPPGLWADNQLGPDGYPVNESGQALPWGNLLVNGYEVTSAMQLSIGALLYNANSTWITPGLPQTAGRHRQVDRQRQLSLRFTDRGFE
jgi:hypothetical protein